MVSINLSEVNDKIQTTKIMRIKMENNGIKKSELISGTRLSKTAVNRILFLEDSGKDYRFGPLLKVIEFLKIKLFI